MIEYTSTLELLRKKVALGLYKRDSVYSFDVDEIMEELRKDPFYDLFPDDQLVEYAIEKGLKESDVQVELIVSNLKKQEQFKKFTEDQLYEYAYGIQNKNYMDIHVSTVHSFTDQSRPNDPIWGQYTYEEILQMEAEGVEIPDEFLNWAHAMQDANSYDYQVESDGSEEQNTVENLDNATNNDTQASVQKKAQAYSSQADAQQELIQSKCDEVEPLAQDIVDKQDDLLSNQKQSMDDTESKMREWRILDNKAKSGTLTDLEQRRYKDLSAELGDNKKDFENELETLSNDIDELMTSMDKITMLIDVNDKINTELEDTSVRMAFFEGDKNHGYLGTKKDSGKVGITDTMHFGAMGRDVSLDAAVSGTKLNIDNVDIKRDMDTNIAIGDAAAEKVDEARKLVQDSDNTDITGSVQPRQINETQDDKVSNENNDNQNNENSDETVIAMAPAEIANESENINTIKKTEQNDETEETKNLEEAKDSEKAENTSGTEETENSESKNVQNSETNIPKNQNDSQVTTESANNDETTAAGDVQKNNTLKLNSKTDETKVAQASETDTNTNTVTDKPVEQKNNTNNPASPVEKSNLENAEGVDNTESLDGTELVDGAEPVENTAAAEENTAAEDPMQALTSQFLSECTSRQSEMDAAGGEVTSLLQQVNGLKDNRFADNVKMSVSLKSRMKEYEGLANKAQSGQELSSSDLQKISELESYLNTDNGEYVSSVQNKLAVLNAYSSAVDNLNQLSDSNNTYGTAAVAQGKAYAESQMGDKTDIKKKSNYILLNKEKRYDLLYGKSGESLGRDLIDSGENLIRESSKNLKKTNNIVYKMMSNFVGDYSEQLNGNLTNMTSAVSPLQSAIAEAIAQQNAKKNEEQQGEAAAAGTQTENPMQNTNNIAVPEPEQIALNAEELANEEEITNTGNANDVNSRIAANSRNAQRITALNNESSAADREITQTLLSYNTVSNTVSQDDERGISNISLNSDKLSSAEVTPSQLKLSQKTNTETSAATADDTTKLKSMERRMPQLGNRIDANSRSIDRIVNESLLNTPEFDEENPAQENAYNASVTALNMAADGRIMNNSTISLASNVQDNSKNILAEDSSAEDAAEIANDVAKEGAKVLEDESSEEEEIIIPDTTAEEEPEEDVSIETEGLPININENSSENDLETVCLDNLYEESDENAAMLNDNGTKLLMENQAKEAAKAALNEDVTKGGFKSSGSASLSMGQKLQNDNQKSETARTRRFTSYEDKNRRAALADKVEDSKKVVMKRGKKKNS